MHLKMHPNCFPDKKSEKKIKGEKNDKKQKMIKLLCWNKGNSTFDAKKDEMEILIKDHSPLLLGVIEANIGADHYLPAIAIDGYSFELDNLRDNGFKTRTMVYIKDEVKYKRRNDLETINSPTIWLEFFNENKPFLVFVGYREWCCLQARDKKLSRSMKEQLKRLDNWSLSWKKAEEENKTLIMLGDYNIDTRPWTHPHETITDYQYSMRSILDKLRDMCTSNNLDIIQLEHTRTQGPAQNSSLDVIISNRTDLLSQPTLIDSSSDHKVISINKAHKTINNTPRIRIARSYKTYSKESMLQNLDIPAINKLLWCMDTNTVANELVSIINQALNRVAPIKKMQMRNNYAPHLKEETKSLMKMRDRLKAVYQRTKEQADLTNYKRARNDACTEQRKDKKAWASNMVGKEENNPKRLWNSIKTVSGDNKTKAITKLIVNGGQLTTPETIANGQNHSFRNKITKMIKEMPAPEEDLLEILKATKKPKFDEMITLSKYIGELKRMQLMDQTQLVEGYLQTFFHP